MSTLIEGTWNCPQCGAVIEGEQKEEIVKRLKEGECQIEFHCEDCCEDLTADTTECDEGMVDLNEDWVYD